MTLSRFLVAGSRQTVVWSTAVNAGDLGRPAVTWDEVLSAVVDKIQQETADPEVILVPKITRIKPRCRIGPAVGGRLLWKPSIRNLNLLTAAI